MASYSLSCYASAINVIQNRAAGFSLGVGNKTPNLVSRGEMG